MKIHYIVSTLMAVLVLSTTSCGRDEEPPVNSRTPPPTDSAETPSANVAGTPPHFDVAARAPSANVSSEDSATEFAVDGWIKISDTEFRRVNSDLVWLKTDGISRSFNEAVNYCGQKNAILPTFRDLLDIATDRRLTHSPNLKTKLLTELLDTDLARITRGGSLEGMREVNISRIWDGRPSGDNRTWRAGELWVWSRSTSRSIDGREEAITPRGPANISVELISGARLDHTNILVNRLLTMCVTLL